MLTVTSAQLKAAAPHGNPAIIDAIANASGSVFAKYDINSLNRVYGFLSTAIEETNLNTLSENLNYTAERAHEVWPSVFRTAADAQIYAGKPEALANRVYGGRMGNTAAGDGWRYRGQGLIQITGKNNFALVVHLTGLDAVNHPEIVTSPEHMLECAVALFVNYPGILGYCDLGTWYSVWSLIGDGKPDGRVINLPAHQAALAAVQKAIPKLVDTPAPATSVAPPVIAAPSLQEKAAVQAKISQLTASAQHLSIWQKIVHALEEL